MVADVRRLVFVVRERRGQRGIVWMREIIVPEKPFLTAIKLIAVGSNPARLEVTFFASPQPEIALPKNFPFRNSGIWAVRPHAHRGVVYARLLQRLRQELAVGRQGRERVGRHQYAGWNRKVSSKPWVLTCWSYAAFLRRQVS